MKGRFGKEDVKKAIKIMGLDGDFSADDVKRRYRQLHKQVHPDKGGSDHFAQQVNEAREILLDWLKRGKPGSVPEDSGQAAESETARRQREEWERAQQEKQGRQKESRKDKDKAESARSEDRPGQTISYKKPLVIFYCTWFGLFMIMAFLSVAIEEFQTTPPIVVLIFIGVTAVAAWFALRAIYIQVKRPLEAVEKNMFFRRTVVPLSVIIMLLTAIGYEWGDLGGFLQQVVMAGMASLFLFSIPILPLTFVSNNLFDGIIYREEAPDSNRYWWQRRGVQTALRFWADGALRVAALAVLAWTGYATVKTDLWAYSPFTDARAESVLLCWPIHYFDLPESNYPDYNERMSYISRDKMPPDIAAYYDPIYQNIRELVADPQGDIQEAVRWGGFPVIFIWGEGQRHPDKPRISIEMAATPDEQVCGRSTREAQYLPLSQKEGRAGS